MISRVLLMPRATGEGERIVRVLAGDAPGLVLEVEEEATGARREVWLTPTRLQTPVQLLSTRAETAAEGRGLYVNEATVEELYEPTDPLRVPGARQPRRLTRAAGDDAQPPPLLARYARALEEGESDETLRAIEAELEERGSRWDMEAAALRAGAAALVLPVPEPRPVPRAVWDALAAPTREAYARLPFEELRQLAPARARGASRAAMIDAVIAQKGLRVPLEALEPAL